MAVKSLILIFAVSSVLSCKTIQDSDLSIRNGTPLSVNEYPNVGHLRITDDAKDVALCTATLICSNVLLTAAHCVLNESHSFGFRYPNGLDEDRVTSKALIHPLYVKSLEDDTAHKTLFDVALVNLDGEERGRARNERVLSHVKKALGEGALFPIAGVPRQTYIGRDILEVVGYGMDKLSWKEWWYNLSESDKAGKRRRGILKWRSYKTLSEKYPFQKVYIGDRGDRDQAACYGDSGGPLITTVAGKRGVIGVVSTGSHKKCNDARITGFTSLDSNRPWLVQNIRVLCKDFPSGLRDFLGQ